MIPGRPAFVSGVREAFPVAVGAAAYGVVWGAQVGLSLDVSRTLLWTILGMAIVTTVAVARRFGWQARCA